MTLVAQAWVNWQNEINAYAPNTIAEAPGGEPVQPVGEVDRVGGPGDEQVGEDHEQPIAPSAIGAMSRT